MPYTIYMHVPAFPIPCLFSPAIASEPLPFYRARFAPSPFYRLRLHIHGYYGSGLRWIYFIILSAKRGREERLATFHLLLLLPTPTPLTRERCFGRLRTR